MCIALGLMKVKLIKCWMIVSILISGEDSGWFVDCDLSLLSYSDDDDISRHHKEENESDTEFSLSELDISDDDGGNDDKGDEDPTGYDGVQAIDSAKLRFLRQFFKDQNLSTSGHQ